jgi:YggT family protein
VVAWIVGTVLVLFQIVLFARVIVDWVSVAGGGGSALYQARRVTHAITEPVLAPVRRVVPTLRFGGFGLDLAFLVVFVAILLLRTLVVPLIPF